MTLTGFKAKNHPQQVGKGGAVDDVDDRAVHPLDFAAFVDRHGPFTVDVAAAQHNARCETYYDRESDGLVQSWAGERVRLEFLPGRMRFLKPGQTAIGPNERPPFGCCLLVWERRAYSPDAVSGGLFGGAS